MTITSPAQAGVALDLPPRAITALSNTKDLAWGWGKLAQFLADNPDLAADATADPTSSRILIYLAPHKNPVSRLADIARRGVKAGAKVEKAYDDHYGKVLLRFGPVYVQAYSDRAEVCERVVVGTREVVEEVKDPDALAAVPTITQTRTEEVVEWVCKPILATDQAEAVSA